MSIERDMGTQHGAARGHVKKMRQKAFIRLSFEKDKRGLLVRPVRTFVNGTVKNRRRFAAPPSYNLCGCRLSDVEAAAMPAPKPSENMPSHNLRICRLSDVEAVALPAPKPGKICRSSRRIN